MEIERGGSHSQQPSSSDSGQALALTKIMEQLDEALKTRGREERTIIIAIVQQGNGVVEDVREVELRSSEGSLLAGGTRNESPKKKALELKFLGELPDTVLTSTVLRSKNDECLKLVLLDSETGEIVDCVDESESSVEAEIVVLEGENEMSRENFERRIIKIGEKKKPHFVNRVYVSLKEGVGYLRDVKLGQDSGWTKKCRCRLGARIGQRLYAWTPMFEVVDKRDKDNKKHSPPKLSSEVWRLDQIGRDGKPCKRLIGRNVETLGDFLFWLHVDPEGLKQILLDGSGGDRKWKAVVAQAKTCTTDDQRMHYDDDPRMYVQKSSNEPQTSVVYSFVGKVKGVIHDSHFVPFDNMPPLEQVHAFELLASVLEGPAFGERYDTPFDVESSLRCRSSHEVTASTNSSLLPLSELHIYQAAERGCSSQSIDPNNVCDSVSSHFCASEEMGELCNPADLDHEKHETPSLSDQVSRLVNIINDGEIHKRLRFKGINTVEDFLIQLLIDEEELRQIVSLEKEEWESTASNAARACSALDKMYCYMNLKLKKGVVFNLLGDFLGLLSFDRHFYTTSTLSEHEKGEARELLAYARKNWGDVEPYNEPDRLRYQPSFSSASDAVLHGNEVFECAMQENYGDILCYSPNPMIDEYFLNPMIDEYILNPMIDEYILWSSYEAQIVDDRPRRWRKISRLWFSLKEWMAVDVTSSCKKRKLCD